MKKDLDMTLYLVTDSTYHTEETFYKTIEEACQGGVTLVQLREKNCGGREYLEKAMKVKAITDRYQIPLIIDDRVDVAIACDAAGVHVGSSDLPVAVARKLLGAAGIRCKVLNIWIKKRVVAKQGSYIEVFCSDFF